MNPISGTFILGTAQLGLDYGIVNRAGQPDRKAAIAIIRTALRAGVRTIDTARAYGSAEARLGEALAAPGLPRAQVITKLAPLSDLAPDASATAVNAAVRASLDASLAALGKRKLDVLLLHRASQLDNPLIRLALAKAQSDGLLDRFGVSIQSPEEGFRALEEEAVSVIQMPFNVLDRRWRDSGFLDRLRGAKRERAIAVHIRSVFLQGLLSAADPRSFPLVAATDPSSICAFLRATAAALGRASPADLALAYVRARSWVDGIVLGQESLGQLKANLEAFLSPPLLAAEAREVEAAVPALPEKLLNPARWPRKARPARAA